MVYSEPNMSHERPRYAENLVKKALSHSPIVGILGQRQVGKTTLATRLSAEYATLDSARQLESATLEPETFLENRKKPFAIDEAQLCPELFPAAKERVRVHPGRGQFILTGSVRFTARRLIRESLTGRITNVEILPMTLEEQAQEPLPRLLEELMKIDSRNTLDRLSEKIGHRKQERFERYLQTGGLPGICFFRDSSVRSDRFEAHLDTIMNRDLQLITRTTLTPLQLRRIASYLADHQGYPLELGKAARSGQTSTVTMKKLLYAFEALYLIRPISPRGTVAKAAYFFEDQGLATHLKSSATSSTQDILRGIYANVRQEVHYRPSPRNEIFSFRTHDGTEIPLAFRFDAGTIAIIATDDATPTQKALASARSFLEKNAGAKVIIACRVPAPETRDFRTIAIPYYWLT